MEATQSKKRMNMDPVTLMNILSAVLMLFLAVLQFTPYWQFNGQSSSINGYVWFPLDHTDLVNYLTEHVGAFDTNSVVWMPILTLLLALAGIICCINQVSPNRLTKTKIPRIIEPYLAQE